ncbi:unnamed protein product [Meloidogyne enterolobii]|uniref:Uncharacterized protein n=1 Tax=Meloidogyne enterolobii TaxID=390850 RepID=A0ACB0YF67_MELEN
MDKFWEMVDEFESMPNSKGNFRKKIFEIIFFFLCPLSSFIWLRDYIKYFMGEDDSIERMNKFIVELGIDGIEKLRKNESNVREREINLSKLEQFLDLPFYSHWKASIKLENKR